LRLLTAAVVLIIGMDESEIQRVGLEVASLGGLALQAFSVFILLKNRRPWN